MMLDNYSFGRVYWQVWGYDSYGIYSDFVFYYNLVDGVYWWVSHQNAISDLGFEHDGFFGYNYASSSQNAIPFPETWFLDEEGISTSWS